jgi:hypothetical protein
MKRRISVQFCLTTTSSSDSVTRLSSHSRIGGHRGEGVPALEHVLRGGFAEHEAFEQRVRGEAVGAVEAALGAFARGPQAGQVGARVEADEDPAAGVVLRGDHRDRLLGHVDAEREQLLVDVGEVLGTNSAGMWTDVEVDVVEPERLIWSSIARATTSRGASSARWS